MTVLLNGEHRQFDASLRVVELIDQLGLAGKRVAVERNGEIVPRSQFAAHAIVDGDKLEIVVAVGGG
ncbi:MAG TPA: sulfur carrier protein ThiS [Burkholderiales bacterium]|nr:sulfur carrier protein ThiS [Burkholderiales bacterium]